MIAPRYAEEIANIMESQLGITVPAHNADLLGSGLLDSLSFVELLAALEKKYNVRIDIATLELDDLGSVERIALFLDSAVRRAS